MVPGQRTATIRLGLTRTLVPYALALIGCLLLATFAGTAHAQALLEQRHAGETK